MSFTTKQFRFYDEQNIFSPCIRTVDFLSLFVISIIKTFQSTDTGSFLVDKQRMPHMKAANFRGAEFDRYSQQHTGRRHIFMHIRIVNNFSFVLLLLTLVIFGALYIKLCIPYYGKLSCLYV